MYSAEFKKQAIDRVPKDGVPVTAQDLGVHEFQLYAWRHKARLNSQTTEEQKLQMSDNARLKRDVARLEDEVAFLKKAAAYDSMDGGGRATPGAVADFAKLPK